MVFEDEWSPPALEPVAWKVDELQPFQRRFLRRAPAAADTDAQREALDIRVEDAAESDLPAPVASFEDLRVIPEYALQGLQENGINAPLPIQAQALPLVLSGNDVIGLAQTGSGKTLAFLLPAVVHIEAQAPLERWATTPIALVLAPTRELAVQISDEATKVLRYSRQGTHRNGVWAVCLYGGGNKREQLNNLTWGSHIVVATPGRLIDFMSTQSISVSKRVTYLVLDEADRMLDMGFQGDVAVISGQVRPDRQVLFFSATWSKSVQELARGLCHEGSRPVRISAGQKSHVHGENDGDAAAHQARESILQDVIVVDYPGDWDRQTAEKRKVLDKYLEQILSQSEEHKVLVFVSQKAFADELGSKIWESGYQVGVMHGGKAQASRLYTLDRFRKGEIRLLVATDVLGRGIDIPSVSHVVIFDMGSVEDYIHRIGRTARGKHAKGCALVFFEYNYKDPYIVSELIAVLENSKQLVPEALRSIADDVAKGRRKVYDPRANWGTDRKAWDKAQQEEEVQGLGVQGNWERHLSNVSAGVRAEKKEDVGHNSKPKTTTALRKKHPVVVDAGKCDASATIPDWLEDVCSAGDLQHYAKALEEKGGLCTLEAVLAAYAPEQVFDAERFFRDVSIVTFGHKALFRKWFRRRFPGT